MTRPDVLFHRQLYRDELDIRRVTSWQVPAETESIQLSEYDRDLEKWLPGASAVAVTDSGELGGPALSPAMNRRLGDPSGFGQVYPWAASLFYLMVACRNDHPGHIEREAFHGSLCWRVVYLLVIANMDPTEVADEVGIPTTSVIKRWESAGQWILRDMDGKQRFRRDPKPSEETTPTRLSLLQCDAVHRQLMDFDLEQRIWDGQVGILRGRLIGDEVLVLEQSPAPHYVKVTRAQWENRMSWDREWARRMDVLRDHQQSCDRCRRAA